MTTEKPSPEAPAHPAARLGRFRRAVDVVDERMGIKALAYPVPEHANNLTWSLGGLTVVSFVTLLVTGIYMAQFYSPMPEDANQSVRDLVSEVWLGGFARGLHYWAAQAMFVTALLHLLRVFLHASFKKPREGNWIVGVAMFLLAFLAIFTGTVIKWDQEGYEALVHNLDVAKLLGGAGIWFSPDLTNRVSILTRLYTAHAVIIPGLILLLFVWHALLVKRHKISPHPQIPAPEEEVPEPFTAHLQRVAAFGLVLIGVLSVLAVVLPPVLGPTPVEGIETTRPLWMFWWFFPMEQWFGVASIAFVIAGVFGLLFLVPFLDRGPGRRWRERPWAMGTAVVLLLAIAAISVNVWIYNPKGH
ncbi:cytochrome b N-terminal domain-containing protein [Streptomyces sp. SAI-090]|jgi:ubiquinol-cytochrome c reductase cytochrome b subunit|uniref:cytochrome b n=1 Tax=Streptomyces sp. SAI-090 TaxID=2940545 RepID=UPI002476791F|nr:cytochrome b N-terminal domain-containing protein [Streptomyces sp. SAI-090]MDH6522310.1 quinol-cytochrome oxidoreductase complex cytochrome b subunit [Streptomyces sp. SAI-090]